MTTATVDVAYGSRSVTLEYAWIAPERSGAPLLVFLHEGLGSVAMWRDWPRTLCDAGGYRGLVFSREGYGRSTPRPAGERWPTTFMHTQAVDVLPRLFAQLGVGADGALPWLIGHSDGGSIALIHAANFPGAVAGVVAIAPHIIVEDLSIASIERARDAYLATDLKARLARYHADPDSAFWGWNEIWLDPAFRSWSIEDLLPRITCPLLAVQGVDDEYGTMAQIDGIAARIPHAKLLKLPACGHSPHRDQPAALNAAIIDFVRAHPETLRDRRPEVTR